MALLKQYNLKQKNKKVDFFPALLTTLAASLVPLVIFSVAKGKNGSGVKREGKVYMDKKFQFCSIFLHLSNIKITKYFIDKPRFTGGLSRNNLFSIKDGVYVINLDVKESKEIHWVSLFIEGNTALYFDFFGIEYITQEVLNKI